MKYWKTTDVAPASVERGTGTEVNKAARQALRENNGGIPPNVHLHSRTSLLKLIRELHEENMALRKGR